MNQELTKVLCGFPQLLEHTTEHPTYLGVHLSPICNFRCKKCFIGSQEKLIGLSKTLTLSEIYKIMKSGKDAGIKGIGLTGAGEPLLDNRIKKIIVHANKLGLFTYLVTNASILDKETIELFRDNNVTMLLSLDTLDPNKFIDFTHTSKKVHKKVIENIMLAQKIYKNTKRIDKERNMEIYRLAIHMTVSKKNIEDIPSINKIIKKDTLLSISPLASEGYAKNNFNKGDYIKKLNTEKHIVKIPDPITGQDICGFFRYGVDVNFDGALLLDAHAIETRKVLPNIRDLDLDVQKAHNYLQPIKEEFINNYLDGFCPVRSKNLIKWIKDKEVNGDCL